MFDQTGNTYIGQADGSQDIIKRDASGAFLQRFNVATEGRGSDWIDLASDPTTMFYTSEGRTVKRYDVSTDTQLTDFATLSGFGTAFALRLLADGGLLVADAGNIKRLDAAGTEIQTYDVAGVDGWFALNLDPDGTSFWSGDVIFGTFHKFDIATGNLLASKSSGASSFSLGGLAVFGEPTQGGPPQAPEPSTLAVFGLGLAGMVILRRRRRTA